MVDQSSDEALARALQAQFDDELGVRQQQQPPPLPQHRQAQPAPPPTGAPGGCAGCGRPLASPLSSLFGSSTRYLTALGRHWHPDCFTCAACGQPMGDARQFNVGPEDGRPYHAPCYRQRFHPRCSVCGDFVPEDGAGRTVWSEVPFWRSRACPAHTSDGTRACSSCCRLQPRGEAWSDLDDGRALCSDCLRTAVLDTPAAQPLYEDVLAFFASRGVPLPARPPLALVAAGALNEAEAGETRGAGRSGPVLHTRGLCVAEEQTVQQVMRLGGGPLSWLLPASGRDVAVGPAVTTVSIVALLVLAGLPRLLTGAVLAHEACHAYLRLSGYGTRLAPEVEEGLCQLMASLWLDAQQEARGYQDEFEERLASFLGYQIRTDASPVYGDGYRAAHEAFQAMGLLPLLAHVRQTGRLPV